MKNCCWAILVAVAVLFNACSALGKKNKNRFGSGARVSNSMTQQDNQYVEPPSNTTPPTDASPMQQSSVSSTDQSTTTISSNTSGPSGTQEVSYGTPVPGKSGLVTSPYAPYAGYVDIRGYPPGQEVKCPYTGKLFRVP